MLLRSPRRIRPGLPTDRAPPMEEPYIRDLVVYGASPPDPEWPGGARIAVQFVVNYEEGGENTVLNGDARSETFLHETPGGKPVLCQKK